MLLMISDPVSLNYGRRQLLKVFWNFTAAKLLVDVICGSLERITCLCITSKLQTVFRGKNKKCEMYPKLWLNFMLQLYMCAVYSNIIDLLCYKTSSLSGRLSISLHLINLHEPFRQIANSFLGRQPLSTTGTWCLKLFSS